jgi:hypothetical protein
MINNQKHVAARENLGKLEVNMISPFNQGILGQ